MTLTQEELHEQLHYDPDSGFFYWLILKNNQLNIGDRAGSINPKGYVLITVNRISYKAHRLAWFYVYGYWPENDIDHKDRIKHHNWIENLREASKQCNARNRTVACNNKSGVKGVHKSKKVNKWVAQIKVNKKSKYLGTYKYLDDAVCARLAAEQCLGWQICDLDSSAFQYVLHMLSKKGVKNGTREKVY